MTILKWFHLSSSVTSQATEASTLECFSSSCCWTRVLSSCAPRRDARSFRPLLLDFPVNSLQSASSHSGSIPDQSKGALQRYRKAGWSQDQAIGLEIRKHKHMLYDGSQHMSWAQDIGQVCLLLPAPLSPSLLKIKIVLRPEFEGMSPNRAPILAGLWVQIASDTIKLTFMSSSPLQSGLKKIEQKASLKQARQRK